MKYFFAFIFFIFSALFLMPTAVSAQEENTTYSVQYDFDFSIDASTNVLDVDLTVTLSNLRSDVYINEYTIRFPKNVEFKNLRVADSTGRVPYVVADKKTTREITFKFPEPDSGAQSQNILKLHYSLDDMHIKNGAVHELILPLLLSADNNVINATLHLPENFNTPISLSKPQPTAIEFRTIRWDNVKEKTLYALFGQSQKYDLDLSYSLANNGISEAIQTIALPPDTLYQKTTVDSLEPQPEKTYTDFDGNFIAEYTVPSRSTIDIRYKGQAEILILPQSSMRDVIRRAYLKQKDYILTEEKLWDISKDLTKPTVSSLGTPESIYRFVTDTLEYSPNKIDQNPTRLGAHGALENPTAALCTEYTDLFVGIAREKGIPAREIQGYGYSDSSSLRPQSLSKDILHAWPEFYDTQQEVWYPVDPTWEGTSGIDYFHSFDLNHIVFAIHGADAKLPLAAGFYKTTSRKDVQVTLSNRPAVTRSNITIDHSISEQLTAGKSYTSSITVTNRGNTFIHEGMIVPEAKSVQFQQTSIPVIFLAPYEAREIPITYSVNEDYSPQDTISFRYDGKVLGTQSVRVKPQPNSDTYLFIGSIIGIILLLGVFFKIRSVKS